MKDNKPIVVTTNPKYKFKLTVSKPSFLIPFNSSRFQFRKSQTPTRLKSPNRNTNNGRLGISSEIKNSNKIIVSKSSSRRIINSSQLEQHKSLRVYHTSTLENGNKSLFTKRISNDAFKIVHRKAPSVNNTTRYTLERYNTYHSTITHSSKEYGNIYRDNSKILVKMKLNKVNSFNDHTRNGVKKIQSNLPRCSSERASKKIKPNIILNQASKRKSFTSQNSLRSKNKLDESLKEIRPKKSMNTKSVSEKKLKVNLIQDDKLKTNITNKSKSVFETIKKINNNTNYINNNNDSSLNKDIQKYYSKVRIEKKQFKDLNTSPLLRTKGKCVTKSNISIKANGNNGLRLEPKSIKPSLNTQRSVDDQGRVIEANNSTIILKQSCNSIIAHDMSTNNHPIEENKKKSNHLIKKKVMKFESITMKGYQGQSAKKVNQDNYFIQNNINFEQLSMFVGVCDGHGMFGHEVSEYLVAHLPAMLNSSLITKHQPLSNQSNLNAIIADTFIRVNTRIINDDNIDTLFSGSTCISIIFTPEKITCANVGDSRAIIGRVINGTWLSESLSRDHKPTETDEHDRIIKAGGKIQPYKDNEGKFIGPERVWVLDKDIPGLAMSRSFGDEIAQEIGVLAKPEIIEYQLSQYDKFVVLASDGVWEFIENDECIDIVKDFYLQNDINGALSALYEEASKRWMQKEAVIDDITAVILFLD